MIKMAKGKRPADRGKFSFTRFFQKFKEGESVAVAREKSFNFGYSERIQGRTGKVIAKRGSAYEVEINDINKPKRYMLNAIHLKKIHNVGEKAK